ncbi:MAG: hypothetical protein AB7E76_02765 [Deferribacterales bacterium]
MTLLAIVQLVSAVLPLAMKGIRSVQAKRKSARVIREIRGEV